MSSAADLVMIARVAGSLIVVLVVVALAARMARRGRWHRSVAGLRVVDRTGLTRDASVAVVEVGDQALVLGVTPHGVSVLTVLPGDRLDPDDADDADAADAADHHPAPRRRARRAGRAAVASARAARARPAVPLRADDLADHPDDPGHPDDPDDPDSPDGPDGVAPEGFRLAGGERLSPEDFGRIVEEAGQRLFGGAGRGPDRDLGVLPAAVRLDQYPDLASALRAAGRVQQPAGKLAVPRQPTGAGRNPAPAAKAASAKPAPSQAASRKPAPTRAAPAKAAPAKAAPSQAAPSQAASRKARSTDQRPPSGSVLDPATWRQGLEALRDLTARKG